MGLHCFTLLPPLVILAPFFDPAGIGQRQDAKAHVWQGWPFWSQRTSQTVTEHTREDRAGADR